MKLSIFQPTQSGQIIQSFGDNPAYYTRFLDTNGKPERGHMGIDYVASHGTPLYAVIDGLALYIKDEHGGDGIYIHTDPLDWSGGTHGFNVINWHLCSKDDPQFKPLIPCDGSKVKVKAGQLIGYTDNTGFPFESSGDHFHLGLMPTDVNWNALMPGNGFGGCIDPAPYINTLYAGNIQIVEKAIPIAKEVITIAQNPQVPVPVKLTLVQKVSDLLKQFVIMIRKP